MKTDEQIKAEYAHRIGLRNVPLAADDRSDSALRERHSRATRGDGPTEMEAALDEIEAEIARLRSNPGSASDDRFAELSAKLAALAAQNAPPRAKVPATAKVPARADGFRRVARRS